MFTLPRQAGRTFPKSDWPAAGRWKLKRREKCGQQRGTSRQFLDHDVFVERMRSIAHSAQSIQRGDAARRGEIPV